jgi:O-antigen/teichoic acid export membrane protein
MNRTRTQNAKSNILFGLVNRIINIIIPFISRTLFIYILGAEYLGLNGVFSSILQLLNIAELGFSSAIMFMLYKPLAEKNLSKVNALLNYYKNIYRKIGILVFLIGITLIPFLNFFINNEILIDINIYAVYIINLSGVLVTYFTFTHKYTVLSVTQRNDIISIIESLSLIVRTAIQIFLLYIFKNYYLYIILIPLFNILNNVLVAYISKKMFPYIYCEGEIDSDEKIKINKQVRGIFIGKLSQASRNTFDVLVLSFYQGLISVAIYSNYYFILQGILSFMSVFAISISSGIGNSIATESKEINYNRFKEFNFYMSWLGSLGTLNLFFLYDPFMRLWLGDQLLLPFSSMLLFSIYFYISQFGIVRSLYTGNSGIWWELRYLQLGELITNLIFNFLLGYFFGINGILLTTIFTVFVFSFIGIGIKTFTIYFERSSFEYFTLSLVYLLITLASGILIYIIIFYLSMTNPINIFIRLLITIIIPNIIFLIISINHKNHRRYIKNIIYKFISR